MQPPATPATLDEEGSPYAGWLAGVGLVVLVVLVGFGLWVRFHGI